MDKRFLGILTVIIVVFIGIFAVSQHSSNKNGSAAAGTPTNHLAGEGKKSVTLTEYGDYECPVCAAYYQPLKQVSAQLSSDIYFQFRNLPLSAIHPNAYAGARAAEAAGKQGNDKYWMMHDALYDNQSEWSTSSNAKKFFDTYAKNIGLNVTKFDTDYTSDSVNSAISADLAAFDKTGQQKATPTFFLDGKYLPNSQLVGSDGSPSATQISAAVQAEIAKKNP